MRRTEWVQRESNDHSLPCQDSYVPILKFLAPEQRLNDEWQ